MIHARFQVCRIRGKECGIYGFQGRYKLYPEGEEEPALEGTDAEEPAKQASALGAKRVVAYAEDVR